MIYKGSLRVLAMACALLFATTPPLGAQSVRLSGVALLTDVVPPFSSFAPGSVAYGILVPANASPSFFDDVLAGFEGVSARFQQDGRTVNSIGDLTFYVSALGGGFLYFATDGGVLLNVSGPQLFTGTTDNPRFTTGTFTVGNFDEPDPLLDVQRAVTLTAVPEPATLGLAAAGMLVMAGVHARRKRIP